MGTPSVAFANFALRSLSGLHRDRPVHPCHIVGVVQGHIGPGVPGRFIYEVSPLAPSFSGAL